MADEIKIWAIGGSSEVTEVVPRNRTETERLLEDTLVNKPDMLMPGLMLVGRQTPAAGGRLDLLGVDRYGRLVVFELKRGSLTRDAVTQAIDYCSYLELRSDDQLNEDIKAGSGTGGIERIDDFFEWYKNNTGKDPENLKPVRMVLVGLGADDQASRMVNYLNSKNVDISLMTFQGYELEGKTLLARTEERRENPEDRGQPSPRPGPTGTEQMRNLEELADQRSIGDLWRDALQTLNTRGSHESPTPRFDGVTFYMNYPLSLPELIAAKRAAGSHSLRLEGSRGIRVTFYPTAVHLCQEKFGSAKEALQFQEENPPNAPTTTQVDKQWYCVLDAAKWEAHKEATTSLANAVSDAWLERLKG